MAIDEKKLMEQLIDKYNCYYNNQMYFEEEETIMARNVISDISLMIEKQPKISLENKTSDWISVEEALPNEDGNYLVSGVWGSGKKTVGDCEFSVSDGYFDVCWNFNVLAWMPLPKPYKSEE